MISPRDHSALKDINRKWNNFIQDRKRNAYRYTAEGVNWLTMNEREELLTRVLDILNRNEVKKVDRVYDVS